LNVKAGKNGFIVGKRLGLDANANISSEGPIKIGSLFCLMRTLPAVTYPEQWTGQDIAGVKINCDSDISIDNL